MDFLCCCNCSALLVNVVRVPAWPDRSPLTFLTRHPQDVPRGNQQADGGVGSEGGLVFLPSSPLSLWLACAPHLEVKLPHPPWTVEGRSLAPVG